MSDILNELNDMFEEAMENAEARTLGEILTQSRTSLNLKLVDISKITGLSESLIGKLESDQVSDMKISTMKKLSIAYDVPAKVFISHLGCDEEISGMPKKVTQISNARKVLK